MGNVELKFVKAYRDRHGALRHYFRRRGSKSVTLPGLPGSEEFMAAYQAALIAAPPVMIGASNTLPGTIDALVVNYFGSAAWTGLGETTRRHRTRFIEQFRQAYGRKRVIVLQTIHLAKIMESFTRPSIKRDWLQAIRGLLGAAVPTLRRDNPADGLAAVRVPKSKGFHTWSDEEIARYRAYWPLGTQQRLAMEIGLEGLARRCEIVQLGPQHVKDGRIEIARAKGSRDVSVLMSPELAAAVDGMPKDHLVWFVTRYGEPRTIMGLGATFPKWVAAAGLPARCRLHGLKKGGMRRLAESGATTHEIMGTSGHKTLAMVEVYTQEFDRKVASDRAIAKRIANKSV